ncbi:MAG TPA: hypothetical protein VE398_16885 [Acidobacteriota bacterium]|nr:hypothetical protein [Acidobacteriota bacterium]
MSVFNDDPKARADEKYHEHVRHGEFERAKLQRGWYSESGLDPTPAPTRADHFARIAWQWKQLNIETSERGLIELDTWNRLRQELSSYDPTAHGQSAEVRRRHAAYLRELSEKADIPSLYGPASWAGSSMNYTGIVRMLREVADFLEDDSFAAR